MNLVTPNPTQSMGATKTVGFGFKQKSYWLNR